MRKNPADSRIKGAEVQIEQNKTKVRQDIGS